MLNSSPVESYEGAAAIFTYAGSGGASFWFWVMVVMCVVPIVVALKAESAAESEHD